ncbi:MAG TPA: three-Cys-motif partner protein TcmP [Steroidobacteraceae bacterium]|nr:three-Cys-motif partner protein TcmP [Steroidobacteraceae bacterium]
MVKQGSFGGDWTEEKLARLGKYLPAYTTILKDRPYKYAYIDAFAGPGYRERLGKKLSSVQDLWGEDPDERGRRFTAGSAVVAMRSEPPFQSYIFIEQDASALGKLKDVLSADFPGRISLAKFETGDANVVLKRLCDRDWSRHRAVLFLDPYGMEVEWSTMEAIARTQAIDTWILFPAGLGVNRQLPLDGHVPEWARRVFDRLFGTSKWYDRFYAKPGTGDLFGETNRVEKVASSDEIVSFYGERLREIFPHVARNPLVLCNKNNAPMFALFFAAAHPQFGATAVKIAQDVLKA